MGSRHNRKRTRSRPRNRNGRHQAQMQLDALSNLQTSGASPLTLRPLNTWPSSPPNLIQWQDRMRQLQQLRALAQDRAEKQRQEYNAAMEAERVRMFGGEHGDEASLCGPMLQVVMNLFNGNVDYEDP